MSAPDLADIKARLPTPEAWKLLALPGEPGRCVPSHFRPDKNPSFSIFEDGQRWKDHATGARGDVLDFIAAARRCSVAEAIRWAREHGGDIAQESRRPTVRVP